MNIGVFGLGSCGIWLGDFVIWFWFVVFVLFWVFSVVEFFGFDEIVFDIVVVVGLWGLYGIVWVIVLSFKIIVVIVGLDVFDFFGILFSELY